MTHPQVEPPMTTAVSTETAHTAQVSAKLLVPFVKVCKSLKLDVDVALAHVGLSHGDLERSDMRVSHALVDQLLRAASAKSGRADLGLLAAEESSPEHLDIIEYVARSQPDLHAALEAFLRFRSLLHDALELQLEVVGDRALLHVGFQKLAISHCAHEFVLATLQLAVRRITGQASLAPLEVQFTHARPQDTTLHQRIFRCPIFFGQPDTVLVYARAALATPLVDADTGLARVLERHAVARLQTLCSLGDLVQRVRAMVSRDVGTGRLTADSLARQLGMSQRSLHRRLAAHGCSYRSILDSVRREIALRALRDPDLAISELRERIGFSTGPAFHRAFRRWTGSTPSTFRTVSKRSGE
jgi:AraC-like DNA-binding protein